jgi:hypothetical protein
MFAFFGCYSRHGVELLLISSERRYRFEGDLSIVNLLLLQGEQTEVEKLLDSERVQTPHLNMYIFEGDMCYKTKIPL